jgi:hypothetical protein
MPQTLNRFSKVVFDAKKSKANILQSIENASKKMESYDTNRLLAHDDEKLRKIMQSKEEVFPKSPIRNTRHEEADDIIDRKI